MLRHILLSGLIFLLTDFSGSAAGAQEGEAAPKPIATPEQIRQAQEALRGKMEQMETNAAAGAAATNAPTAAVEVEPPTVKLIVAPEEQGSLPPAADTAEALRRKIEEVSREERKSRLGSLTNGPRVSLPATNRVAFTVNRYELKGAAP